MQAESQRHIACFSESNDSSLMWGHYADGHKGFCLEYDFKSVIKPCDVNCNIIKGCNNFMITPSIAPVIYSKKRFDATAHLFTVIQANIKDIIKQSGTHMNMYYEDMLLISKCLLMKSNDWEYEKEWRLFSPPLLEPSSDYNVIFKTKPTALYIGARTSNENSNTLRNICKEKNIPCYQMIENFTGNDFKLHTIMYDEYHKISQKTIKN